jgi:predicted Zn-dependent peptidase
LKQHITTLPNGLRIITAEMPGSRSVAASIVVATGSRSEDFKVNGGVSHFLEHLLFKGTTRYPSPEAIADAVDAVGGFNNAYTTEDVTDYYIKVPARHRELPLDILADMIKEPIFDETELDRERGVILEEMNVYRDDPARFVSTLVPELLYPGNPLGLDTIGPEEVIRSISRQAILDYKALHYRPGNMVVSVAGKVSHEDVVAQARALLGDLKPGKTPPIQRVNDKLSDALVVPLAKPTAQAHFILASRAYAYNHADEPAARVMAAILGRGMSSRLFMNVRERQGLAYSIFSETSTFVDTGMFEVYAGVTLDKTKQAIESVLAELVRIRLEPVMAAELRKGQEQLTAALEMSQESNSTVADRMGVQLALHGGVKSVDEVVEQIQAVTVEDIARVAQEILAPDNLRLAIIAPEPFEAADEFKELVKRGN